MDKKLFQCKCCGNQITVDEVGLVDDNEIICNKCKKKVETKLKLEYIRVNRMRLVG